MKTVLVTGGAGFIGSNFVQYFKKKYPHYHIVNVDKLTYAGNTSYIENLNELDGYTFIQADIADKKVMEEIFTTYKVEGVINFAAETHVDNSIQDSTPFVLSNVLGTQVLLDLAKKYNIERYHQISTDEVYGDVEIDQDYRFSETDKLNPRNPYSATKASSDHLVLSYFQTHKLPVVITRCSNNFGPHQAEEKFLPTIVRSINQGKKIPVYGDGKNVRDWLFVKDHCRAIDMVFHKGKVGEIYNIATNNEWHNIDIVKKVLALMSASEALIEFVADRPGHDKKYSINASKIQKELGWKSEMDFEKCLRDTVEYYNS